VKLAADAAAPALPRAGDLGAEGQPAEGGLLKVRTYDHVVTVRLQES